LLDVERWREPRREDFVREVLIKELMRLTGLARNTFRVALRSREPPAFRCPERPSKLDPFKEEMHALLAGNARMSGVRVRELIEPLGSDGSKTIVDVTWTYCAARSHTVSARSAPWSRLSARSMSGGESVTRPYAQAQGLTGTERFVRWKISCVNRRLEACNDAPDSRLTVGAASWSAACSVRRLDRCSARAASGGGRGAARRRLRRSRRYPMRRGAQLPRRGAPRAP
jgi:hypothetical protein